jgi:hypothetical protein
MGRHAEVHASSIVSHGARGLSHQWEASRSSWASVAHPPVDKSHSLSHKSHDRGLSSASVSSGCRILIVACRLTPCDEARPRASCASRPRPKCRRRRSPPSSRTERLAPDGLQRVQRLPNERGGTWLLHVLRGCIDGYKMSFDALNLCAVDSCAAPCMGLSLLAVVHGAEPTRARGEPPGSARWRLQPRQAPPQPECPRAGRARRAPPRTGARWRCLLDAHPPVGSPAHRPVGSTTARQTDLSRAEFTISSVVR